ncbi:MAG: hypothetical protein FVQ85_10195 [Planctomycetes bacterium]|nr:hypothetical protein [Planctomycetota bacterium]
MRAVDIKIRIYLPEFLFRLRVWIVLRYRKQCYGYAFRRIPLTQGQYAIVDPERYEELAKHKWFAKRCDGRFYAVRSTKIKNVKMHQVIMGTEEGKVIDHINSNGLDNRKANVRFATSQQNSWNQRKQRGNSSSKYKGVSWEKKRKEWRARITFKGRVVHLGRFDTEKEAAMAYDDKAREFFGEFAWLNFPASAGVRSKVMGLWHKRFVFVSKLIWGN